MLKYTYLPGDRPMPIIDQHDDLCESFLSAVDPSVVSEILKVSSWAESAELLDRDFALIIIDSEGKEHRKFACSDPGNALMSEWYLLNAEHNLPEEAVKVAAANIANAMEAHGMDPTPATTYLADDSAGLDGRRVSFLVPFSDEKTASSLEKVATAGSTSAFDYVSEAVEKWDDLDPYDRHSVAMDLVKVASEVGATVPDHVHQYSGTELNPMFAKIAEARREFSADPEIQAGYRRLSKMAAVMDPEDVVETLYLLDEQAALNHRYGSRIPDPVLSVYGTTKEAEYSWALGGDYVSGSILKRYAGSTRSNALEDVFTEGTKDRFRGNPLSVFKGMPEEQKILVARLATQSHESNNGGR
jgi:hypothetical protein